MLILGHTANFFFMLVYLSYGWYQFSLRIGITGLALHGGLAASGKTGLIPTRHITPDRLQSLGEKDLSRRVNVSAAPMCTASSVRGLMAAVK